MSTITQVFAREVLDSRGRPTVEVDVRCDSVTGRAIVPSGASTGASEAIELRDGGDRYRGWGVAKAVAHVNERIAPEICGLDAAEQFAIDDRMLTLDASPQKSTLGGNALLGVSLAAAHAAAAAAGIPLWEHFHQLLRARHPQHAPPPAMPIPMVNMISGGLHAGGNLDFQDVLAIPLRGGDYRGQLERIVQLYWRLGERLQEAGYEGRLVGDEGGFGPRLESNRQAVALVVGTAEEIGWSPGAEMGIALDVAATHFHVEGGYKLATEDAVLSSAELVTRLESWVNDFPIVSIEDALAEEDWDGWRLAQQRLGDRVRLVGDDLFTTNCKRIARGIERQAANSVLIKLNQIGTLTETLDAIALARQAGWSFVVSARSGEAEDSTIADLAVGVAAPEIKIGSIVRSERLAKYNQLLRIAEQMEA